MKETAAIRDDVGGLYDLFPTKARLGDQRMHHDLININLSTTLSNVCLYRIRLHVHKLLVAPKRDYYIPVTGDWSSIVESGPTVSGRQ